MSGRGQKLVPHLERGAQVAGGEGTHDGRMAGLPRSTLLLQPREHLDGSVHEVELHTLGERRVHALTSASSLMAAQRLSFAMPCWCSHRVNVSSITSSIPEDGGSG